MMQHSEYMLLGLLICYNSHESDKHSAITTLTGKDINKDVSGQLR